MTELDFAAETAVAVAVLGILAAIFLVSLLI